MMLKKKGISAITIIVLFLAAIVACLLIPANNEAAYADDSTVLPVITAQPASVAPFVYGDGWRTLQVSASYGSILAYEWHFLPDGLSDEEENWIVYDPLTQSTLTVEYPRQSGTYFCRVYDRDDKSISVDSDRATVEIHKATAYATIHNKTSVYGDGLQELTFEYETALTQEELDNIEVTLYRDEPENPDVGTYAIRGHSEGENYTVRFTNGVYSVTERPVTVLIGAVSSVYGEELKDIPYEISGETALVRGDTIEDLNISLTKESGADAGKYAVSGAFDNGNYNVTFRPAVYTIEPKTVDVRLVGVTGLCYSGTAPDITCEIIGDRPANLTAALTFDKAVKNAGDYVAYVRLSNKNYTPYSEEIPFSILKTSLKIGLKDTVLKEGDAITAEFLYDGFVEGEDESVLKSKPTLPNISASAGFYTVAPMGAQADNYRITYISGSVQINVKETSGTNATFTGSFRPGTFIDMHDSGQDAVDEHFKRIDRPVVYSTKIESDGIYGEYTAKISNVKKYIPLFLRACIIDEDGNKVTLKNYEYDEDGNFVFTADTTGVLVVYYSLIVPIIIVVAVVLLILIIVIKRSKDKKRYQKAYVGHYVARQYADDMVRRNRKYY